jgi:8-oxo-dGTP pyrophosphatase MutT (NUDIX family)
MEKWKILEEKDVSPSKWFPILKHTVQLANGKIVDDFFTAPMGNVAMILALTKSGKFVFVKQYKHGIRDIIIELPAGCQQEGKTVKETAVIELEEEVGIKTSIDNLVLIGKAINNSTKTDHVSYCYLAKDLEFNSKQNLEMTEEIEIIQVTPIQAIEMVKSGEIWGADSAMFILKAQVMFPEIFNQ